MPYTQLSRHIYLLENDKCLLILDDQRHHLIVFLEEMNSLDNAIQHNVRKKLVHCDKIGKEVIVAFDERKRMLAICGIDIDKVLPSPAISCF